MKPAGTDLISTAEWFGLITSGPEAKCPDDLATFHRDGTAVLSVKGLQYFRAACAWFEMGDRWKDLLTRAAVQDLALDINERMLADPAYWRTKAGGRLQESERFVVEAYESAETLDEFLAARRLAVECSEAGPNVVPVRFPKR
jgi:hypothetical protein